MDALEIMRAAVKRGVPRPELVLAAAACARSVLHMVPSGNTDALRAIEAAERWANNPTEVNAMLAAAAEFDAMGLRLVEMDPEPNCSQLYALLAASSTAAAAAWQIEGMIAHTGVTAVDYAQKAAAMQDIDLSCVITANLL